MSFKIIHTDKAPAAIGPYSQAVLGDGLLFVSGQIPVDSSTGKVVEGITNQTHQSLKNGQAILNEAGYTLNDVMKCTVYLQNMDDFKAMNEVYAQYFSEHKPARVALEVAKLPLGVGIEIEMIAYKK